MGDNRGLNNIPTPEQDSVRRRQNLRWQTFKPSSVPTPSKLEKFGSVPSCRPLLPSIFEDPMKTSDPFSFYNTAMKNQTNCFEDPPCPDKKPPLMIDHFTKPSSSREEPYWQLDEPDLLENSNSVAHHYAGTVRVHFGFAAIPE